MFVIVFDVDDWGYNNEYGGFDFWVYWVYRIVWDIGE